MSNPRYPFQQQELEAPTLTDRILRRPNRENALIELTNHLATDVMEVSHAQVAEIERKYEVDFSDDLEDERAEIFSRYLAYTYANRSIDQAERDRLNHLISLLRLDDETVRKTAANVQQDSYRKAVRDYIDQLSHGDEEPFSLEEVQQHLLVPDTLARQIEREEATTAVQSAVDQAVEDALISPEEEAKIRLTEQRLGATINLEDESQQRWDRFRLYWDLQYGPLKPAPVDIRLQKTETCYYSTASTWNEVRSRTRRIGYHGPTARVRIAKGFYWRFGSANINRVTEDVLTRIDEGQLYFTNKRVIFVGDNRTTNIRLNRILDFVPYSDGIEIIKDAGRNPIFLMDSDIDIATIILNRLLTGEPDLDG